MESSEIALFFSLIVKTAGTLEIVNTETSNCVGGTGSDATRGAVS